MQFNQTKPAAINLPNLLSSGRLAMVPVLLCLAWNDWPRLFLACFVVSLATDFLDGLLARTLNQTSELGTKLDSWADFATMLAVPFCAWWLWPAVIRREAVFVIAALGSYFGAVLLGFLKFRRLTSYHTWAGKAAAVSMGITTLVLLAGGPSWPFECATPILVLAGLEEIAMTALLRDWQANVPSFWHALKLNQQSKPASRRLLLL